jgi:hypothetical protein
MASRYTQLTNAAYERGNYLDNLGESLNNVTMSATNYVSQAKNTAVSGRGLGLDLLVSGVCRA